MVGGAEEEEEEVAVDNLTFLKPISQTLEEAGWDTT